MGGTAWPEDTHNFLSGFTKHRKSRHSLLHKCASILCKKTGGGYKLETALNLTVGESALAVYLGFEAEIPD